MRQQTATGRLSELWWEEFGEAVEQDCQSVLKKFWKTIRQPRSGKQKPIHMVFSVGWDLLTPIEPIVHRWKKYFEDILNPTNMHSEEAEPEDFGLGYFITGVNVNGAVKQLAAAAPRKAWTTGRGSE